MDSDAIYCFDRAKVLLAIYPEGGKGDRVVAEISEDALRDVFGAHGGGDSLVEACRSHFDLIEAAALRHYQRNPKQPVRLETTDFTLPAPAATDLAA